MHVNLGGKRWRLAQGKLRGRCTKADRDGADEIVVDDREKGRAELETWLHEAMHAQDWERDGNQVRREAYELSVLLWKLGYRRSK